MDRVLFDLKMAKWQIQALLMSALLAYLSLWTTVYEIETKLKRTRHGTVLEWTNGDIIIESCCFMNIIMFGTLSIFLYFSRSEIR